MSADIKRIYEVGKDLLFILLLLVIILISIYILGPASDRAEKQ